MRAGGRKVVIEDRKDGSWLGEWFDKNDVEAPLIKRFIQAHPDYIIYGEWTGGQAKDKFQGAIKDYDAKHLRTVRIFDVFDTIADSYIEDHVWRDMIAREIPELSEFCVPILAEFDDPTEEQLWEVAENNTYMLEEAGHAGEGIVLRNPDFRDEYGNYHIVNANYSASYTNSHSKQFNVAENLAWDGYSSGSDPFSGWYYKEKAIYDEAAKTNTYNGVALPENWQSMSGYQLSQANNAFYSKVGHYLNIINASSAYTGFAVTHHIPAEATRNYKNTYAQEFSPSPMQAGYGKTLPEGLTFGTATANGNVSVDEYERILTAYVEKVRAEDPALTQAKADLQAAIKAHEDAQAAAADKDAVATTAQAAYDQAYAAAEKASADDATAQKGKTDAKAALDAAQEEQSRAEAAVEGAKDAVNAAQAEVAELESQIESAAEAKAAASGDLIQAEADLPAVQQALDKAKADREDMFAGVADAEQAVKNAQGKYDEKLAIRDDAATKQLSAADAHGAAQQLLEQSTLAANTAEVELSKARSDAANAAEQVRLRQQAYDAKEIEFAELSKALEDLDAATVDYNEKISNSNKATADREAGDTKVESTENAADAAASEKETAKGLLVWDVIKDAGTNGRYPKIDELVAAHRAASASYVQAITAYKVAQDTFAPVAATFAVAQSHADASYANVAAAQGIYDEAVEWNTDYVILDGEGSKYEKGCGLGLRFRFSGPVDRFIELRVDGTIVDPASYTITSGSTIATLSAEYMEGLTHRRTHRVGALCEWRYRRRHLRSGSRCGEAKQGGR